MDEKKTLNLPALKIKGGEVSVKKSDSSKKIAAFDIKSVSKSSTVNKIITKESINNEMKKQQQLHAGLDLVLMGDLTGSMSSYHSILKNKFKEICSILFSIIPNLKIGIIFYLDHGSGDPYVTSVQKLTTDIQALQNFIDCTCDGNGGDADEAVEDALNDALNMNWTQYSTKSVILFGDAKAHEANNCPSGFDYNTIVQQLYKKNVVINSVFCQYYSGNLSDDYEIDIGDFSRRLTYPSESQFFSWIANVTGGVAITAEQIDDIIDIIKALAAKDAGKFEELEKEILKVTSKPIPALEQIKNRAKELEQKKKRFEIGYSA